jgi:TolB-like protein/Flp pilus assembly protein TadD
MAAETEDNLRLEIGHVLFIDLVGYSKLLIDEQKEQMRRLTDIVLATRPVQEATNEQLVRLPTGDGMALVFRNSLEEPARCALEIARALRVHPEIRVRMGIHSGPVSEVSDVNERANIAGAGINLAQRVMNCGDAGHILVSQRVAEDLVEYRQWAPYLHELGECEVKHGLKVSLTNLYGDDFGNATVPAKLAGRPAPEAGHAGLESPTFFAELRRRNVYRAGVIYALAAWLLIQIATQAFPFFAVPNWVVRATVVVLVLGFPVALTFAWAFELTPEGIMKTDEVPPGKSIRWKAGRKIDVVIIGVLALAIAFLLYLRFSPSHRQDRAAELPEKSIAVLPFANLSDDKENAFFAEGIQDDILTSLSRIGDLKVISRTSVMPYRADRGKERNTREIGESLGVAYLLEGSVRGERSHFVVNVQLINAREDRQVWAEHYDKTLEDSLGLQGELAAEIANKLHARLSPEEKARVTHKPTTNADAYALYLRAFALEHKPDTLLQDYKVAVELYSKAIALDPDFALAHARLACTSAAIFHFQEPLEEWANKARVEAATALRLDPNLAEGHFALGLCLYWFDDSYEAALAEFAVAARLSPNDSDVAGLIAAIKRRKGQFRDAIAEYERATKLDPQNPNITRNLAYTYWALRKWPEAQRAAERWRQMAPDSLVAKIQMGYLDFQITGKTESLQRLLAQIPTGTDPDGIVTATRWDVAMIERDFAGALDVLRKSPRPAVDYLNGGNTPKTLLAGCTYLARGDRAAAQPLLEQARGEFAAAVEESPVIANVHANLGLVCAYLGRKEEAIGEGRRAVELRPISKDAVDGAIMLCYLAVIYAQTGENDQAITLIQQLLQTPGAIDSVGYSITTNDLKYRWEWDRLRKDPRFQKLLEQNASPRK